MKRFHLIIFIFLSMLSSLHSQNFSFFDNFEVCIRPLEYVMNNWNTKYTTYNSTKVEVYNPLKEGLDFDIFQLDPIQLKNYISQEYGLKYFLKMHKNFKIGLGINYKRRKLEYDLFIPNNDIVIWALRYKAKYDYLGYSLNFRVDIPKIKSNINFYWELNSTFNKDKRRPELTTTYFNSYALFIQTQHSIPKSIIAGPHIGFDFNTVLYKNIYLNFHLSHKYHADYFSRVFYFKFVDNTNEPIRIIKGIAESKDYIIGLGLIYQISRKSKNRNENN